MNRILIPIDLNTYSDSEIGFLKKFLKNAHGEIHLVNVIDANGPNNLRPDADLQSLNNDRREYERYMAELSRKRNEQLVTLESQLKSSELNVQSSILFGNFKSSLEKYIKEKSIDTVLMRSSGETSLTESFTGNHAIQVIDLANVPVIVFKDQDHLEKLNKSMIILSHYPSGQLMEQLGRLHKTLNLSTRLVRLSENKEELPRIEKEVKELASIYFEGASFEAVYSTRFVETVSEHIERHKIDIVVHVKDVVTGPLRLFNSKETEALIQDLSVPVIGA